MPLRGILPADRRRETTCHGTRLLSVVEGRATGGVREGPVSGFPVISGTEFQRARGFWSGWRLVGGAPRRWRQRGGASGVGGNRHGVRFVQAGGVSAGGGKAIGQGRVAGPAGAGKLIPRCRYLVRIAQTFSLDRYRCASDAERATQGSTGAQPIGRNRTDAAHCGSRVSVIADAGYAAPSRSERRCATGCRAADSKGRRRQTSG